MAEQVAQQSTQQHQQQKHSNVSLNSNTNSNNNNNNNNQIDVKKKSPEVQIVSVTPGNITRERSFVRPTSNNQQNMNKRRSLAFNHHQSNIQQHQNQMRGKPAMEIYRPPNVRIDGNPLNKLNVHAQEFTMNRSADLHNPRSSLIYPTTTAAGHLLQHSKSNATIQQMHQHLAGRHAGIHQMNANIGSGGGGGINRPILVSHPMQIGQIGVGVALQSSQLPLVNSPSSGNILHQSTPHRVKFAPEPHINKTYHNNNNNNGLKFNNNNINNNNKNNNLLSNPLQRSKSLSSADALTRGLAGLGLALNEATDIGTFPPEIQILVEKAIDDSNQLTARQLMELADHVMKRAVEGRRYALPISKLSISIITKERNETFLEALLNTCRQWYQEREKILYALQGLKSPSRTRFTAFMAFLTEMFCQLKRRQLQLRTQCDGAPPPLVLLTLLSKCCEDCVKPPVRSLSEIECLFFVLTCIGRDLETHLPQQLESLLSSVRDAFLNSSASAPAIRRTLLQLIELQASRWQLPGNTVLYYYPSSK